MPRAKSPPRTATTGCSHEATSNGLLTALGPEDTKSIVSRHGVWWQKTNPLSECRFAARRGTLRSICEGARTRLRSVYLIVCSM